MMKKRRLLPLIFAAFGLVVTLGAFFVAPPKAEAVRLEPGCYISAPNDAGAPEWRKDNGCTFLKKVYKNFNPDNSGCYISWATIYGPTPPVKAATCYGAEGDDTYIPQPGGSLRLPFNNIPGAAEALTIDPQQPNCLSAGSGQSYTAVACTDEFRTLAGLSGLTLEPGNCYVPSDGLPPKITEIKCTTIQNAVTRDQQILTGSREKVFPDAASNTCGDGANAVNLSVNIGCQGKGNPIIDMIYSITRFLSVGAGIVCVASMIVGAIQFTASGGNPKATSDAIKRMVSSAGALVFFLFIYAILNWIVPGGLL